MPEVEYNHYWRVDEAFKVNALQKRLLKQIVLENTADNGIAPDFNNTKGIGFSPAVDQKGEDFAVSYTKGQGEVNTMRWNWDNVVCKVLLVLSLNEDFHFWSDGIDWDGEKFHFDCDWDGEEGPIAWANKNGIGEVVTHALVWISLNSDEVEPDWQDRLDAVQHNESVEPSFCGDYEYEGITEKGRASAKFWNLHEADGGYKCMWGKIGHGSQGSKVYTYAEAVKKSGQKVAKGYVKQ